MASKIIGCGGYLPKKILTNLDLEKTLDTTDEWIQSRSGIKQRSVAGDDEYTSHMAYQASLEAINSSGLDISDIDLIIVSTTTPDKSFPGIACKLQGELNLGNVPAFDLQAVCSGFIYGLEVANNMLKDKKYTNILFVCAEKMTSLLNWEDRSTSVLFGDGAGAVILQKDNNSSNGIIDTEIHADGRFYNSLCTNGGVSSNKSSGTIEMDGKLIFKMAADKMSESVLSLLEKNKIDLSEIDYLIPHQANIRIINRLAKIMNLNSDKVITTIDTHANCSAASIPLALNEYHKINQFKTGDLIVFTAFGAGLTWGSVIYRW